MAFDVDEVRVVFADMRRERGLTLAGVAKEVNISSSTLSRFECGLSSPDTQTLFAIRRWLGDELIDANAVSMPSDDCIGSIHSAIKNDGNLTDEAAQFLCDLMGRAYKYATNVKDYA